VTIHDYRGVSVEDYIDGASVRVPGYPGLFNRRSKLLAEADRLIDKMARELRSGPQFILAPAAHARNEPLVPAPSIADRVLKALATAQYDWLTPASLAKQLEVSEGDVWATLAALGSKVRRPIGASGREHGYYRLSAKPPTWQERVRKLKAIVTFTPLAESSY
jgi:biotin operon repressor